MNLNKIFPCIAALLIANMAAAQQTDSLMNALNAKAPHEPVIATFKSPRLVLSQTTETIKKYNLDFKVAHRFGDIGGANGGSATFYGFDNSSDIYIAFEYGITDRLSVNFGRSKYEQMLDLGTKYLLLQQTTDDHMPVSVALMGKAGLIPYKVTTHIYDNYSNRFSFVGQAIVSRKFSSAFSLQLSPTIIHRNYVADVNDENTLFAMGAAGRLKLTKRFALIADTYYIASAFRRNNPTVSYYMPLGVGIEIETGGHVFTLNFSNSQQIIENNYLPNSTSSWSKGQFRFGFTISRIFTLKRTKST